MIPEHGADMNRQVKNGDTALIEAARLDCMKLVCELLERNADKTIKNENNNTALDVSKQYSNYEVAFLLNNAPKPDPNQINWFKTRLNVTGELDEEAKSDPYLEGNGERALTEAIENGNTEVVSELLFRSRNVVA